MMNSWAASAWASAYFGIMPAARRILERLTESFDALKCDEVAARLKAA